MGLVLWSRWKKNKKETRPPCFQLRDEWCPLVSMRTKLRSRFGRCSDRSIIEGKVHDRFIRLKLFYERKTGRAYEICINVSISLWNSIIFDVTRNSEQVKRYIFGRVTISFNPYVEKSPKFRKLSIRICKRGQSPLETLARNSSNKKFQLGQQYVQRLCNVGEY